MFGLTVTQENLKAINSFREESNEMQSEARNPKHIRQYMQRWEDSYKPILGKQDDQIFDRIMVVPGNFEIEKAVKRSTESNEVIYEVEKKNVWYYTAIEHFDNLEKKFAMCSGGVFYDFEDRREKCHYCDAFDADWEANDGDQQKMNHSRRRIWVVQVVNFARFAKITKLDENGSPVTNREGEVVKEWVALYGKNDPRAKKAHEFCDGRRQHWKMAQTHWGQLTGVIASKISGTCAVCRSQGTLERSALLCGNKECSEVILDLTTEEMAPHVIEEFVRERQLCKKCGELKLCQEIIECSNGCNGTRRMNLFEAAFSLRQYPSNNKNKNITTLDVGDWGFGNPTEQQHSLFLPLDLAKLYEPTPLDKQEEMLGGGDGKKKGRKMSRSW